MAKQNNTSRVKVAAVSKAPAAGILPTSRVPTNDGQQAPTTPTPGASPPKDAKEFVDAQSNESLITVHVPTAFIITQNDHVQVSYAAGTQEMLRVHAEHWYAQAVGVKVHSKKRDKPNEE